MGLSSWGGIQYFVIPIAIFVMALPFFRSDHKFLLWAVPLFWAAFLGTAALFEWPGERFIVGLGGAAVVASTVLMAATIFVKSRNGKRAVRNSLVFLIGSFGGGMALIYANAALQFIPLPSFRYANALNPFLTTVNPLVDSVAEHSIAGTAQSFWFLSVLMIFAGIGAWLLLSGKLNGTLKGRPEMIAFALITGMVGVYTSSAVHQIGALRVHICYNTVLDRPGGNIWDVLPAGRYGVALQEEAEKHHTRAVYGGGRGASDSAGRRPRREQLDYGGRGAGHHIYGRIHARSGQRRLAATRSTG